MMVRMMLEMIMQEMVMLTINNDGMMNDSDYRVHDNGDGTHCVCLRPKLACNPWQLHRFMGMHGNQGTGCNLSLTLVA